VVRYPFRENAPGIYVYGTYLIKKFGKFGKFDEFGTVLRNAPVITV